MQRIGVFICWCGSNIAATVDVERVAEVIKSEPHRLFGKLSVHVLRERSAAH